MHFLAKRSKSKNPTKEQAAPASTPSPVPRPVRPPTPGRSILRKPSVHFPHDDESLTAPAPVHHSQSAPIRPSDRIYSSQSPSQRASLATDHLPPSMTGPYPPIHPAPGTNEQFGSNTSRNRRASEPVAQVGHHEHSPHHAPHHYHGELREQHMHPYPNHPPPPNQNMRPPMNLYLPPFPQPGLRTVVRSLTQALRKDKKRIQDYLDIEDLLEGKLRDAEETDGLKDCTPNTKAYKFKLVEAEKLHKARERQNHVFGAPLKCIAERASMTFPMYGYQHSLPIVVVACVEELYRSGISHRNLFHTHPNERRMMKLITHFDQFSTNPQRYPSLQTESPIEVAAVLASFIDTLPFALFHRTYFDAMFAWCVQPTLVREQENARKLSRKYRRGEDGEIVSESDTEDEDIIGANGLPSFHSRRRKQRRIERGIEKAKKRALADAHPEIREEQQNAQEEKRLQILRETFELEKGQVAIARFMLLLLPPHAFSLIAYVLSFFSDLLDHPRNGVSLEDLGRMFGWKMIGGPNKDASQSAMMWLISRWKRIADGFKSDEVRRMDAQFGAKKDSSLTRIDLHRQDRIRPRKRSTPAVRPTASRSASSYARNSRSEHLHRQKSTTEPTPSLKRQQSVYSMNSSKYPDEVIPSDDSYDTPVISPFSDEDIDKDIERDTDGLDASEKVIPEKDDSNADMEEEEAPSTQRNAFQAIEVLLQPKVDESLVSEPLLQPPCRDEADVESIYSQDADVDDIIDIYSSDSADSSESSGPRTPPNADAIAPLQPTKSKLGSDKKTSPPRVVQEDDFVMMKRQLEAALAERDNANTKLEEMKKVFEGVVLR